MKKLFFILFISLIWNQNIRSQVSTNSGSGLAATYATLADAISALNAATINSPVVITLDPSNPQTAPAGGYSITASGSASNTILIQGSSNTITAPNPQTAGHLFDAIFKIIGGDFISIDGFVMQENPANTTTAAATNNMTEWGVALLYATTTNGAQNNTISNCTISLNRSYQNTFGIYSNSTHAATTPTTSATATSTDGANSGLTITDNSISNVNMGIVVIGPFAAADHNDGLTIGGASNSNTLSNFGTTSTFSAFANVSSTVNGILVKNTKNFDISYNILTSSDYGTTTGALYGIQITPSTNAPTGTFTNSINYNNISLKSGVVSGNIFGIFLDITTASTTSTLNVNNNDFDNFGHNAVGAGDITFISNAGTHLNQSISNNTFTNMTVSTTGDITFISNLNTLPANGIKNINGNAIVTAFNKTGSGGFVTGYYDNGDSPTGTTHNNNNNNFSHINTTGSTIYVWSNQDGAIGALPSKTIQNNTFTNITSTGANPITVISVSYASSGSIITGNTITNINCGNWLTAIETSSATNFDVYSNTINTLNSSSMDVISLGGGGTINFYTHDLYNLVANSYIDAILIGSGTHNVYDNTIHGLSCSWGGSNAYPIVRGIYLLSAATVSIYNNKIYDLSLTSNPGSPNAKVEGIGMLSGTNITIYNNLLGDFRAALATGPEIIRGISVGLNGAVSTTKVYNNTVYLSGSTAGVDFGSSGIYHTANTDPLKSTLDLRNNLIINNCTAKGAGAVVAFRRSDGTTGMLANYASTSNNNVFYAGVPGTANLIYSDGTSSAQTIGQYNIGNFTAGTIAPRDVLSFSELPNFISTLGSSTDFLHINTAIATQIESSGTPIGIITEDFDGDTRNLTTPDIGADEFSGIYAELSDPVIIYTSLSKQTASATRIFTGVAITDASDVNTTAGTKPRVYFKKSTDANDASGWKYVEANGTTSPFDFTIDFSLLNAGSVTSGNIIQYFVVAQDLAPVPNVGINSGNFTTTPASVALSGTAFPITGTINQFLIAESITGVITVGTSGNYTTLTGTDGLFAAINNNIVTGNVTVSIISNITETGVTALNQWIEEGAGNYTITIQPNAATLRTVSGNYAGGLVRLNGADRVSFDGRYAGSGQYLKILNASTSTNAAVVQLISLGTGLGATDNTIRNCNITAGSITTTNFGIYSGSGSISTTGTADDNDNLIIRENTFNKSNYGIYCRASASGVTNGLQILNNEIGSATASLYIGKYGIDVTQASGAVISGNTIFNFISATITNPTGLLIGSGFVNSTIAANKIYSLKYTASSGYGGKGIDINTGNANCALLIYNNQIYDITGDGFTNGHSDAIYGIRIRNTQGGINLYYNTVNLSGNISRSGATVDENYALYIGTSVTNINLKNNILSNSIVNTTGVSTSYAVYSASANTAFSSINFNDYYASGTEAMLGYLSGNKTTLTAWQTASTQDASSISSDPLFTSSTNLVPQAGSPVLFAGTAISGITTDYSGTVRGDSNPSIGAYEFENGSTGSQVLYGAADNASNYSSWTNGSNEGAGFGSWSLSSNQGSGYAGYFLGNPSAAGISGMSNPSFGLYANPAGSGAYVNADRTLITPLPVGGTLSFDWGVNWDGDNGSNGNKGINLYTGGTGGTQIININMAGSAAITINGNPMFNNYGTQKMTLHFEYQSAGNLRVYATGRNGSETYDQVIAVAGAPDAIRFYASELGSGDQRQPYFNNFDITTSTTNIQATSTTIIKGEVNLNSDITTSNLTIGSGNILNINPNTQVTVGASLSNFAGTSGLVLKSNETGTGSLIHNTNNVDATVERYLTGNSETFETFDFHQVSVPLNADATAAVFTGMYVYRFDQTAQDFISMGDNPATVLDNNTGYTVFYPNTSTTASMTGKLNNGSFTALTGTDAADEFSLVPNPYPSAINWDAASGWTKTNLQDAFYIWNPVSNNYVTWSEGAGTALSANIPVGQSFFVEANAASPVLSMTNAVRAHSTQAFWKESNPIVPEVFRLNIADNESADEMIVRFDKGASIQRSFMDADKLYGASIAPQLYSVTPNNEKLTINALPHSTQTIVVPVGIEYPESKSLTFNASGFESFESSVSIFLEDKLLNKTIDLRENPVYSFTHAAGADPMRFNLMFYGVNSSDELGAANYNIWANNDKINVQIPDMTGRKAVVQLIDQQGRILDASTVTLNSPSTIQAPLSSGLYIVRVIVDNQAFTSKVFIR